MRGYLVLAAATVLFLSGCVNPYCRYYKDLSGGIDGRRIMLPVGDPRIVQGADVIEDAKEMRRDGYVPIGQSSFNAAEVDDSLAVQQARNVHAEVVLMYKQYTETWSGSMAVPMGPADGGIAVASPGQAVAVSAPNRMSVVNVPYHTRRYDYYATYWGRIKPPSLGVFVRDLTEEERRRTGSNKGAFVWVVLRGSPAWISDIIEGDIIKEINNQEVVDAQHFVGLAQAVKAHDGELQPLNPPGPSGSTEISLSILRGGTMVTKHIRLRG